MNKNNKIPGGERHFENYKTRMEELKVTQVDWKNKHC